MLFVFGISISSQTILLLYTLYGNTPSSSLIKTDSLSISIWFLVLCLITILLFIFTIWTPKTNSPFISALLIRSNLKYSSNRSISSLNSEILESCFLGSFTSATTDSSLKINSELPNSSAKLNLTNPEVSNFIFLLLNSSAIF